MFSEWLSRVGSSIPRGFSRQYILSLLRDGPLTGKEIIDKATVESDGKWKPSPGLVYPLLGRLLGDGLVVETGDGKYAITKKGLEIAGDLESFNNIVHRQLDVMFRVGNVGKFVAMDLIDRLTAMGSAISSNLSNMTAEERQKYRDFLVSELQKIEEDEKRNGFSGSSKDIEKVDVQ